MNDDLMPVSEAAELLKVHVRTVHRWVESGRLEQVMKVPGLRGPVILRRSQVEALAEERVAS